MDDPIIQFEVVLNYLNTLFAKAIAFKDEGEINKLSTLEHEIYYGEVFSYEKCIEKLKESDSYLKKYD